MPISIAIVAAIIAYLAALIVLFKQRERLALVLGAGGLVVHLAALVQQLFPASGLMLGIGGVASLVAWEAAALWLLWGFRRSLARLGLFVLPVAIIGLAVSLMPVTDVAAVQGGPLLALHILSSVLAYGLLTIAAGQALLLAVQERALRQRRGSWLEHGLPPLEAMEGLLFQSIAIGFWLLSCSLLSGFFFVEDLLAQHLAHKTVLSVLSWLVFGGLLLGRARRGWRGRTAVKATLWGYLVLVLAYFGSRWVLEVILGRHWG